MERLVRYCARGPLALERLHPLGDLEALAPPEAQLLYRLPGPDLQGRTALLLSPSPWWRGGVPGAGVERGGVDPVRMLRGRVAPGFQGISPCSSSFRRSDGVRAGIGELR